MHITKRHDLPFATYRPRFEPAPLDADDTDEALQIALGLRPATRAAPGKEEGRENAPRSVATRASPPELSFLEPIRPATRYSPNRIYTSYFKTEENMAAFGYHHQRR